MNGSPQASVLSPQLAAAVMAAVNAAVRGMPFVGEIRDTKSMAPALSHRKSCSTCETYPHTFGQFELDPEKVEEARKQSLASAERRRV